MKTSHFVCSKCEHNYSKQEIAGNPICMLVINEEKIPFNIEAVKGKENYYHVVFSESMEALAPRLTSVPESCLFFLEHLVHNGLKEDS